jgi:hypothetical protein
MQRVRGSVVRVWCISVQWTVVHREQGKILDVTVVHYEQGKIQTYHGAEDEA